MGGTFETNLFVGFLTRAYIVGAAYLFLGKSLKIKSVVQCHLEFLKAVRFGRYVLNELVWWASCEGLHGLGSILIPREILENQICDPVSAGFLECRQRSLPHLLFLQMLFLSFFLLIGS